MSNEKSYMFQYGNRHMVIEDTDLITLDEALELFENYTPKFKDDLINEYDPQMCIWMDCHNNESYGETLSDWQSCEFGIIDGDLYQRVG